MTETRPIRGTTTSGSPDLLHILNGFKHRGIRFRSLTEAIDTETPTGRAIRQMIGVLAEPARSLIVERTRAGVKAAQRRGAKFGRKSKLTPDRLAPARKMIERGTMATGDHPRLDGQLYPLVRFDALTLEVCRDFLRDNLNDRGRRHYHLYLVKPAEPGPTMHFHDGHRRFRLYRPRDMTWNNILVQMMAPRRCCRRDSPTVFRSPP